MDVEKAKSQLCSYPIVWVLAGPSILKYLVEIVLMLLFLSLYISISQVQSLLMGDIFTLNRVDLKVGGPPGLQKNLTS